MCSLATPASVVLKPVICRTSAAEPNAIKAAPKFSTTQSWRGDDCENSCNISRVSRELSAKKCRTGGSTARAAATGSSSATALPWTGNRRQGAPARGQPPLPECADASPPPAACERHDAGDAWRRLVQTLLCGSCHAFPSEWMRGVQP